MHTELSPSVTAPAVIREVAGRHHPYGHTRINYDSSGWTVRVGFARAFVPAATDRPVQAQGPDRSASRRLADALHDALVGLGEPRPPVRYHYMIPAEPLTLPEGWEAGGYPLTYRYTGRTVRGHGLNTGDTAFVALTDERHHPLAGPLERAEEQAVASLALARYLLALQAGEPERAR